MEAHQITKRELLEMLQPFDEHDKIAVIAPNMIVGCEAVFDDEDKPTGQVKTITGEVTLFIESAERTNENRTAILIKTYEA